MGWVYMLRCRDGSYYVGSTRSLEARVFQHQTGVGAEYTKSRLPVALVWSHECERIDEAFALESASKDGHVPKREALIRGDYDALPWLSRGSCRR